MCNIRYWECEHYHPENPPESRCITEDSVGCCIDEETNYQIFKGWNEDILKYMKELCQIKNISISEYIQGLIKRDLADSGLLIINGII